MLLIASVACTHSKKNESVKRFAYDSILKEADKFVSLRVDSGFSGVVLVANNEGIIFHKAYASTETQLDTTSAYAIASQAKSFTALAIMQLYQKGLLSIDDPILKYFNDVPTDKRNITIRHLLTHTSGLGYCQCTDGETDALKIVSGIFKQPLNSGVGEKWDYQNENYILLGLIVEKVSKMMFRGYVQQNILDVADMKHTGQSGQEKEKSILMASFDLKKLKKQPVYIMNYKNGFLKENLITHRLGGYFSTTGDMYKLALAVKHNKLIADTTLEISLQPQNSGYIRDGLYWGYGWVYTMAGDRRINIFNSGREDWMMNSRMYMLENGFIIIVWSQDTLGPEKDAAATVVSIKLLELFEKM